MAECRPIAIVTGASRGAGRGIAVALGRHGCTVYVTGRSQKDGDAALPGTIFSTADAVTRAGGRGIPVACDSGDDAQIDTLFRQVDDEQGRLDILVNNACAIHNDLPGPGNFWEKPIEIGKMIDIGVRSGYNASWHGASRMVAQGAGLIVISSSPGGGHYCMGPAYGAHKAGMDKMAFDMAVDFGDAGVPIGVVSIWMGGLLTERVVRHMADEPERYAHIKSMMETPEFTGEVIWAMFNDPDFAQLTGQTVIGAEMGKRYGIVDVDGNIPTSIRDRAGVSPTRFHPYKVK